jgi:hypothetical protein
LQKSIRHTPFQKLTDAFIAILAGAHGLAEVNTRVRSDEALQRAFGREACAEQSVVQETLNACTGLNVQQMQHALDIIFRQHSSAHQHKYGEKLQLLDVDLTGMPCGPNQEGSRKGYFGHNNIRYGRQLGRVVATYYEEIVVDRLLPGKAKLTEALQPLVLAAEQTLALNEAKRKRTVLRVDAGGGSLDDVNWMLERGYQVHCKDYSSVRAEAHAATVGEWFTDSQNPERQVGWVTVEGLDYVRLVRRLAMRWASRKGPWRYAMLISTLESAEVIDLLVLPVDRVKDRRAVALAYAKLYNRRGGAVEIDIKQSKQGLGITKRSKKKFAAQQMVMLLGALAHNILVWVKRWLIPVLPRISSYGALRLVRDVMSISGAIEMDAAGKITGIVLNKGAPLAGELTRALDKLPRPQRVAVYL